MAGRLQIANVRARSEEELRRYLVSVRISLPMTGRLATPKRVTRCNSVADITGVSLGR